MSSVRLDDLYKMVAHIYGEQNAQRPASSTFAHFVEVCGMLTSHDRQKKREEVSAEDALCKSLAWYFPLLAKFRVKSVEELVYRKFPYACPYCRLAPHSDERCKTVRGTKKTVDHDSLRKMYSTNAAQRPASLDEWQKMFRIIYPRNTNDTPGRSAMGLMEELGELAEAVRVFDRYPKYFAGEAADVFSYLMGFANEHALRLWRAKREDDDTEFSLEKEFLKRYPGICVQCGYSVCVCPYVPDSTVGRLAKELDLFKDDDLFELDLASAQAEADETSKKVLDQLGGLQAVVDHFPFDRGDVNRALVKFCLRLADVIPEGDNEVSERLRSAAIRIAVSATYPGSREQPHEIREAVESLQPLLKELGQAVDSVIAPADASLSGQVGRILSPRRPRY